MHRHTTMPGFALSKVSTVLDRMRKDYRLGPRQAPLPLQLQFHVKLLPFSPIPRAKCRCIMGHGREFFLILSRLLGLLLPCLLPTHDLLFLPQFFLPNSVVFASSCPALFFGFSLQATFCNLFSFCSKFPFEFRVQLASAICWRRALPSTLNGIRPAPCSSCRLHFPSVTSRGTLCVENVHNTPIPRLMVAEGTNPEVQSSAVDENEAMPCLQRMQSFI